MTDYAAQAKGVLLFLAIGLLGRLAPGWIFWPIMGLIAVLGLPSIVTAVVGPIRRRRRSKKSGQKSNGSWTSTGL